MVEPTSAEASSIEERGSRTPPDGAGEPADDALAVLQAVADPVRWTVLDRLAAGPACVCNLQEHVTVAGNLLSYHLRVLREAGLVTTSRRGRWVDYALADDATERMRAALPGARVAGHGGCHGSCPDGARA